MTTIAATREDMFEKIREFVRRDFEPHFGARKGDFPSNPLWGRLRELGSELWLDTGSLDESGALWSEEMSALTTNNTLLNREVQSGQYDVLIKEAAALLEPYGLVEQELVLEICFILNACHALELVETYDALVSVEEHTDLAHDLEKAVETAERYHAICPERFIVKMPMTPAGLLATRRVCEDGMAVNHTLGFSARQNYVIARIGNPDYVNVFMGRLNSFVIDNELGPGENVGERATLASQAGLRALAESHDVLSRQIGASLRSGDQIRDLAGLDVFTMPPAAAGEFVGSGFVLADINDRTGEDYPVTLNEGVDRDAIRIDTLWDINDEVVACLDALDNEDIDSMTPDQLVAFFGEHGCGDVLVPWSDEQIATSAAEGKIPKLDNWRDALASGAVGLDSLMNLGGLNAFIKDQADMDERVRNVLSSET
jgi:transaldolase